LWLTDGGFTDVKVERQDCPVLEMIRGGVSRVFAIEVM
jgi:hypothetical protein